MRVSPAHGIVRFMKSDPKAAQQVVTQAETLLASLKGITSARVQLDASGKIARINVTSPGVDERQATRNVQSALFAALGISLEPGMLQFSAEEKLEVQQAAAAPKATQPVVQFMTAAPMLTMPVMENDSQVLEFTNGVKRADLNVAARVAFDTLRAAQSSFHGFVFDGAELVKINGGQYVVVAVSRSTTEARYCGAAPVIDSVSTASARALMNAVGMAAMGAPAFEFVAGSNQLESLEA